MKWDGSNSNWLATFALRWASYFSSSSSPLRALLYHLQRRGEVFLGLHSHNLGKFFGILAPKDRPSRSINKFLSKGHINDCLSICRSRGYFDCWISVVPPSPSKDWGSEVRMKMKIQLMISLTLGFMFNDFSLCRDNHYINQLIFYAINMGMLTG